MRAIILLQYFTTWEKVLDYINLLRLLSINIIIYLAFSTVLVPSVPPSGTEKKNLSNYFSFQKKFVKKKKKSAELCWIKVFDLHRCCKHNQTRRYSQKVAWLKSEWSRAFLFGDECSA